IGHALDRSDGRGHRQAEGHIPQRRLRSVLALPHPKRPGTPASGRQMERRRKVVTPKSFSGRYNTILAASSLCRRGRRSTKLSYGPILAIHSTLLKLQNQFAFRFFRESWSNLEQRVVFHARAPQHCPRAPVVSSRNASAVRRM